MHKTPLLDQLVSGPFPSFVKDLKRLAATKPQVDDLLGQLERSYKEKITHWKHGGIVGVLGYGSGIIGRYSDLPDEFPGLAHFHTMRINQPSGWFYTSAALREVFDIWDKHGSGLLNMHGATGDLVLLGTRTDDLEPCFQAIGPKGLGHRRFRVSYAQPLLLLWAGPLRMVLLRHHGSLLSTDPGIPVRNASAFLPLQI